MAGLSKDNPLRNAFNERNITTLAQNLQKKWPDFRAADFLANVFEDFESLQFGQRNERVKKGLERFLPADFEAAVGLLLSALGPELAPEEMASLDSFIIMPQCGYVSIHAHQNVSLALKAYKELTKRMSAEGDLRFALEADYDLTMRTLHQWCNDPNSHVRRLVSEGTRPRLPLAGRIRRFQEDPRPLIELLNKLVADPSLYVRRSVANNINDIAKDNPDIAMGALRAWANLKKPEVDWVVSHAARSLLKAGNKHALELMGFGADTMIELVCEPVATPTIEIGSKALFEAKIISKSTETQSLLVDYVVHLLKANGKTRPKVFKHRKILLKAGQSESISIGHKFIDTSGRTHYPGAQTMELQINGERMGLWEFELKSQK